MHRTLPSLPRCCSSPAPPTPSPRTYDLDPDHTQVEFSWNHFGFSNIRPAASTRSTGDFQFDPVDPTRSQHRRHHSDREHRHRRRRARRTPAEPGFLRCRAVPDRDLQEQQGRARRRRQPEGQRRPDHPRRHQAGGARRHHQQDRRASDGGPRRGRLRREDDDQAQRFRHQQIRAERQRRHRDRDHQRDDGAEAGCVRSCGGDEVTERHDHRTSLRRARRRQCRLARQPAHVLVRPLPRPAVDGLWPAAGDQRGPRRARRAAFRPRPRQHGNPQLRAGRRARAQGQQRWRRRAASRRTAVDERGPRRRAQRVQCIEHRAGAFPADLDPARSRQRAAGVCAAGVRSGRAARTLGDAGVARWRRRQHRDPPAGVVARRAAGRAANRWQSRSIRRGATGCTWRRARSTSTAARWRRAMRWDSSTRRVRSSWLDAAADVADVLLFDLPV